MEDDSLTSNLKAIEELRYQRQVKGLKGREEEPSPFMYNIKSTFIGCFNLMFGVFLVFIGAYCLAGSLGHQASEQQPDPLAGCRSPGLQSVVLVATCLLPYLSCHSSFSPASYRSAHYRLGFLGLFLFFLGFLVNHAAHHVAQQVCPVAR